MRPTVPPTFNPNEARYWDPRDLEQELRRVFTVCHGCRMCVGFCPSFPSLFERVDAYVDRGKGEIEAFTDVDFSAVNDLCYQCKLCYFKCPYTPDDEHPFALDFPRLMLRHKALRAQRDGVTLQDQVLGEPQLVGRLGQLGTPVSNWVSSQRLLRKIQEKATGISADFNLPPFAETTLRSWHSRRAPQRPAGAKGQVVLFETCTVNYNLPAAGMAAVQVLEHNGFEVLLPETAGCCGMPNMDGGDVEAAQAKARKNVAALLVYARAGIPILIPGPTCSYVFKKDYPELLGTADAESVSEHSFDVMEFLRNKLREKTLRDDFETPLGRVGCHAPCHLRAQKIGFPAMQIFRKVPDTEVEVIQECSAVDGTWGMKAEYFELGRSYAQKLVKEARAGDFDAIATDCPLSALRLEQELGVPALHPVELLNRAYGLAPVRALETHRSEEDT